MKLENLQKTPEFKSRKRVGRGPGSGMGKTATRGENGQKSRSGASITYIISANFSESGEKS